MKTKNSKERLILANPTSLKIEDIILDYTIVNTKANTCVMCGAYIPEDRQVCVHCENEIKEISDDIGG